MKYFRTGKLMLGAALCFCSVSVCSAQTSVPLKVLVLGVGGGSEAEPVVEAVKAKIGGTSRYQVKAAGADLVIAILCLKALSGGRDTGLVCAATYTYNLWDVGSAEVFLSSSIYIGPSDGLVTAEKVFERFVGLTSDAELDKHRAETINNLQMACLQHARTNDRVSRACNGLD